MTGAGNRRSENELLLPRQLLRSSLALLGVAFWLGTTLAPAAAVAETEINCRVRHEVRDPRVFTEVVLAERTTHADTTFRYDRLARELATERIEVPTEHSAFASQPLDIGPVAKPAEWGIRLHPIHRTVRFHNGLDIRADPGAPVASLADGTVVVAAYRGGYGQTVVVDHGAGFATLYAHLSIRAVDVGQVVSAGQTLGNVGSTGASTGPHLHLETRLGGIPVDPRWFVPVLPDRSGQLYSGREPIDPVVAGGRQAQHQIERMYLIAFGRLPSAEETEFWLQQCARGVPLESMAELVLTEPAVLSRLGPLEVSDLVALSESPEAQAALAARVLDPQVRRLYLVVLGREPDVSGSYHWSGRRVAGVSLVDLAAEMGSSAEYVERFGGLSDQEFLEQLYLVVFDRLPDAGGRSYWLDRIEEVGRWRVLVGFVESAEGQARLG